MTAKDGQSSQQKKQEESKSSPASVRDPPNVDFERKVKAHVAKYAQSDNLRATWDIAISILGFFGAVWFCTGNTWLHTIVGCAIGGLFLLRKFVIFHDACHKSSYSTSALNYAAALVLSPFVITPPSYWNLGHNYHHKHSNNLDKKQFAQTAPLTREQYQKLPALQKVLYFSIYNGVSLVSITPILYFFVVQRFFSKWYENVLVFVWAGGLYYYSPSLFAHYIGMAAVGAILGVFLFHVQHTFESSRRFRTQDWRYFENAMEASSYYLVPWILKFFTYGIEYHHIHHLNTRVPGYRLKQCHEEAGELFASVPRVTVWESLKTLRFSLYDEDDYRYISFGEQAQPGQKSKRRSE